ncbi:MAG: anaerobic sulfatase-maturation protein [Bacteroidales bacterium]|nr:anaerobic sulfatase-maturation protein [Bacteroidales bacterium]
MGPMFSPFEEPLYVMLKPAGAMCNLACEYCYYLEKSHMYNEGPKTLMSDSLLEHFVKQYIESQTTPNVLFLWHGGETMMRPLSFYQKALQLQKKYARGRMIDNAFQTNGTMLTDEWCRFFKENNWLVGVSIDGPKEVHNAYRQNRLGQPSFDQVMRGINLLNKHGVMWNAMAVVNDLNVKHPQEFYRFFKSIGCRYIQFTPIVERFATHEDGRYLATPDQKDCRLAQFSITPEDWGNFLCTIFDEWVRNDVGQYFIQIFDATLANWVGVDPGLCTMARSCGHAGVMEFNGDVYSCDHFVFPEYKLGNIRQNTLLEMMYGEKQQEFARLKQGSLPGQCRKCDYLFACNGGCPKDRFAQTVDGEPNLNYLCKGYHQYFKHVAPYMDYMKNELMSQRPPANVMKLFK